jgi:hypothetical protein
MLLVLKLFVVVPTTSTGPEGLPKSTAQAGPTNTLSIATESANSPLFMTTPTGKPEPHSGPSIPPMQCIFWYLLRHDHGERGFSWIVS